MKRAVYTVLAVGLFFGGVAGRSALRGAIHGATRPAHASVTPSATLAATPQAVAEDWHATPADIAEYAALRTRGERLIPRFSPWVRQGGGECWFNSADEILCQDAGGRPVAAPEGMGPKYYPGDAPGCPRGVCFKRGLR